jgi:hypothetical protein
VHDVAMMSWAEFAEAEPETAVFGAPRLHERPGYLATVRKSGAPRVHPVTPIITSDGLFLFMEPNSPRDGTCGSAAGTRCTMESPTTKAPAASSTQVAGGSPWRMPPFELPRPRRPATNPRTTTCYSSSSSARRVARLTEMSPCPPAAAGRILRCGDDLKASCPSAEQRGCRRSCL